MKPQGSPRTCSGEDVTDLLKPGDKIVILTKVTKVKVIHPPSHDDHTGEKEYYELEEVTDYFWTPGSMVKPDPTSILEELVNGCLTDDAGDCNYCGLYTSPGEETSHHGHCPVLKAKVWLQGGGRKGV